jgi:putative two-component system response regulator
MISNGECGVFSKKLIQCLTAAAKQPEWLKVTKSQA